MVVKLRPEIIFLGLLVIVGSTQAFDQSHRTLQNVVTMSRSELIRDESGGDRVSQIDTANSQCRKGGSNAAGEPFKSVELGYFFKIESSTPLSSLPLHTLADSTFELIEPSILWCAEQTINIGDGNRRLVDDETSEFDANERRLVSVEEARRRRLDIVALTAPQNRPVSPDIFGSNYDPCESSNDEVCTVVYGQMIIVAQESDGLQLMSASILDAMQAAYDDRGLLVTHDPECTGPTCIISNLEWLGATVDEAIFLIDLKRKGDDVTVAGEEDDGDEPKVNEVTAAGEGETGNNNNLVFIAAVPVALLLALGLLFVKSKRRNDVKSPADLEDIDQDHVIVGTGDPPRAFHDGLYHYTRSGARYLSTNCADCAETRRIGFFTDGDLPTISEGRLYDPESPSGESYEVSYEESDDVTEANTSNKSQRRKMALISPSSKDLGNKHSTIDVHQCTSATCRICAYRPQDVSFVASPAASPTKQCVPIQGDGLGESNVV